MCELMPRHALVLILDDAIVWNFESEFWFIAKYSFQLCEIVCTPTTSCSLECHVDVCNELLKFCTRNCLLYDFSSRPSHSKCCPYVSFYLLVLLVLVIPRSTNCDSLIELGQSLTSAILISVSQELHQMSEFS